MLTINNLLKILIGTFALGIIGLLSFETWGAWTAFSSANYIAHAVEASSPMFQVLNALRIDRANTNRMLIGERIYTEFPPTLTAMRHTETNALRATILALQAFDFPSKPATVSALDELLAEISRLQPETVAALSMPFSSRPSELAPHYVKVETDILDRLTNLGTTLNASVALNDALVDRLFAIYANAWAARTAAGEASLLISNNLPKGTAPADTVAKQIARMTEADAYMATLARSAADIPLSADLRAKLEAAKGGYFSEASRKLQVSTLAALVKGEKTDMTGDKWNDFIFPAYEPIINVALSALNMAYEHADAVRTLARNNLILLLTGLAIAIGVAFASLLLIVRRITQPLAAMVACMSRLLAGDYSGPIPGVGRSDEIGGMAKAVAVFRDNLARTHELEVETARSHAELERQRKTTLADLASRFESSVGGIVEAVAASARDLDGAAKIMSRSAADTSQRSTAVAAAAEEASANVTVVASSAEELGASVTEIGRQVRQSTDMSMAAVEEAHLTASIVSELATAAARINDVVALISTIAGQTNLLALNATIESARAGEAGRGFAVVAAEVKELATQTAKATADISTQIGAIQSSTTRAVGAIGGIAETIQAMNTVATMISASVAQQGAATGEIVRNIAQASSGTAEVTDNITGVARAAGDTGAAANEVLNASAALAERAVALRAEVDRFVAVVRAA